MCPCWGSGRVLPCWIYPYLALLLKATSLSTRYSSVPLPVRLQNCRCTCRKLSQALQPRPRNTFLPEEAPAVKRKGIEDGSRFRGSSGILFGIWREVDSFAYSVDVINLAGTSQELCTKSSWGTGRGAFPGHCLDICAAEAISFAAFFLFLVRSLTGSHWFSKGAFSSFLDPPPT